MQDGLYEIVMLQRYTAIFLLCLLIGPSYSQNISHEFVAKGIEAFYMADFEESIRILQNVVLNEPLGDEEQFYSYLFIGFSHIRLGSDNATVRLYFQQAVNVMPDKELDPLKIPPDLYDAFMSVKKSMLGTIVINSEPPGADVMLLEPMSSKINREVTPAIFPNLLEKSYQVLVTQNGYDTFSAQVDVRAGVSDTLNVILFEKEKSFFAKYWPYGAGALAATAAILVLTAGSGGENPPKPATTLPNPPARP